MKKHASYVAAATLLSLVASSAHAVTDFEREGKDLAKLAKQVACLCNLNGRMGKLIANASGAGPSVWYVPSCQLRTFDGSGALSLTSTCGDFEVLR